MKDRFNMTIEERTITDTESLVRHLVETAGGRPGLFSIREDEWKDLHSLLLELVEVGAERQRNEDLDRRMRETQATTAAVFRAALAVGEDGVTDNRDAALYVAGAVLQGDHKPVADALRKNASGDPE